MNKILTSLLLGACTLAFTPAFGHSSEKPKHGGILQSASDLNFELVPQADGVLIYVDDHGKPLATQGMSGKLTVLTGSNKTEAELKPAGDNKLEAKGVKLAPGAKAVAALTTASKKAVTVRFTAK